MSRHASPRDVAADMTEHRQRRRPSDGGPLGREVELDHPDDPIRVLSRARTSASARDEADAPASKTASLLRRKVSFFSSPLNADRSEGNGGGPPASASARDARSPPIAKVVNTSLPDANGKYAYIHAYYRSRERYAATLLGGEGRHPALAYFGDIGEEDVKHRRRGSKDDDRDDDDGRAHGHGHAHDHTLFLPPTALERLSSLDVASLALQRAALRRLGRPGLARRIERFADVLQHRVLPPLRMENVSAFFLLLLPAALSRLYHALFDAWDTMYVPDLRSLALPSNLFGYLLGFLRDHKGEAFTLSLLFLGTSTIARFVLTEYRLVKEKAEAISDQTGSDGSPLKRRTFTTMEMFEYRIDYHFSTSKWAKVALLLSFTFVLIAVGAGLLVVFTDDRSISNAVWIAWTYVADPGTHADCPEAFLIRLVSFAVTLGGMLIFALMIGIISDYIADKVDDLKKGKSRIIDIDHTVMLGWNDKSLAIIQQVALANESEGGGNIVVLASNDKEEMEETLASALVSNENPLLLLGTEVIFRSGNPLLESELRRVSTQTARSIVSLSHEELDPDEADATQVRQVMALKAFDEFVGSSAHVVVEVQDVDNEDLFPLVAPDFAEVVVTHDIIGRLMIQCARCPGLASVLEAMMGFEGSEFYFEEWPELAGKTFFDITCRFDEAIPIGVKAASDGKVYINPENDHIINEGDKILVLAEDDDSYEVNDGDFNTRGIGNVPKLAIETKNEEKIMFCGWRRDMADMIKQLDEYVEKGSELWLLNMVPAKERAALLKDKGNKDDLDLENLVIRNVVGNPVIRRDLNNIRAIDDDGNPSGQAITLDQFDSILILADAVAIDNGANMMSCDSRSLSSLLIIQDIQKKLHDVKKKIDPNTKAPCDAISEILDSRTKSLLSVANCKGYIMSNQIISSVMAQVSEEKDINAVLREILTAEGSETYIRPVTRFIDLENESEMSFWDVALRARQLQEVAIGFKPEDMDYKQAEELIINPPDKSTKRKWARGDMIITFSVD